MDPVALKVLDLSHHNCGPDGPDDDIDFAALAAFGIRGIIHKASQGASIVDRTYAARREHARAAGLLWGAYHFATGEDPADQVAHFLEAAQPDAETLLALDHEPNKGNELDLDGCRAFLDLGRQKLGRPLVLYSGNLIKEQLRGEDDFFAAHRLWLCEYGPRAIVPAAWSASGAWLWQFSGDGIANRGLEVPGLARGNTVDMNSFAGSDEDLAAQWAA
jgi:lysozyme